MAFQRILETLERELGALPVLRYVGEAPTRKTSMTLPALLIELAEIIPLDESGTNQTRVLCHFDARLIMSDRTNASTTWMQVLEIIHVLTRYDWPEAGIGRAKLKEAEPDHFSPELQGHRIWRIEWTQEVRVGDNFWDGEPPNVTEFIVHNPYCPTSPPPESVELPEE